MHLEPMFVTHTSPELVSYINEMKLDFIWENGMKIWQNIIKYVATDIPQLNMIVVSRKCLTLLCTKFCPVYYGIMGVFTLDHFMHVHCYLTAYALHSHFTT